MNIYQKVSVILALFLYLPLGWKILKGKVTQNLATFILWGSLDAIAGASMLAQGSGNYQLPFAYASGAVVICLCILKSKTFSWTGFETFVSFLVLGSVLGWHYSGPYLATIFSTTGVALATLPQLRDSWREPEKSPMLEYVGYMTTNSLSIVGAAAWTVEERLYSVVCAILCVLIILASLKKYFMSGFEEARQ